MAICHGPNAPYGCGHHDEHVAAAKLGWFRRKRGAAFQSSDAHRHASTFAGSEVSHAHEHETHKGRVVFK